MFMKEKFNLSEMTEKELKELSRKTDARLKEDKSIRIRRNAAGKRPAYGSTAEAAPWTYPAPLHI